MMKGSTMISEVYKLCFRDCCRIAIVELEQIAIVGDTLYSTKSGQIAAIGAL